LSRGPCTLDFLMQTERQTGTIKTWNPARGFGFLTTDDHRDIFVHVTQWVEDEEPRKGDRVSFIEDIGRDRRTFAPPGHAGGWRSSMTDDLFRISGDWAVGADEVQWIICQRHRRKGSDTWTASSSFARRSNIWRAVRRSWRLPMTRGGSWTDCPRPSMNGWPHSGAGTVETIWASMAVREP
jgi:cold shock CspA family protein